MWNNELEFQKHLLRLLEKTRYDISTEYVPFQTLKLKVDIKSIFQHLEEWRELKIIKYRSGERSIQNLWKGIGKVLLIEKLIERNLEDQSIHNILSLPKSDFRSLHNELQSIIPKMLSIELVTESSFNIVGG